MRTSFFVLAAAVAAPVAPLAIAPAAAATVAQETAERDAEVVCRRGYQTTSRMGTPARVCRTRAEWRQLSRASQRTAGDESHSGTGRSNTPGSASQDF